MFQMELEEEPVPEILRSGNHEQIAAWRKLQALERTARQRPDLLGKQRPRVE
jgi:tRNA (guanine37-N1)-methyltransferase